MGGVEIKREFEKSGLLLLIITLFGSALNYLFQILSGRLLSVSDYGSLTVLFSVIAIAVVPASTFSMYVSRNMTMYRMNPTESGRTLLRRAYIGIALFSILVAVLGVCFSPALTGYLGIPDWIDSVYTFLLIAILVALSILTGVLQGSKRFLALGIASLVLPLTKMISLVGIRLMGSEHGFAIVFLTMIAGNALVFLATAPYLRRSIRSENPDGKTNDTNAESGLPLSRAGSLRFIVIAALTGLLLAYMTNMDSILVKRFFTPEEAGQYSAAMMFGRVLLYIPSALVLVMFPMIAEASARDGRTLRTYFKTVSYSLILMATAFLFFLLLSTPLIQFLYGARYSEAPIYILWSMLNILPISILTINMNYELARGKPIVLFILMTVFGVCDMVYAFFFHQTINQILQGMFAINLICLLCSTGYIVLREKRAQVQYLQQK